MLLIHLLNVAALDLPSLLNNSSPSSTTFATFTNIVNWMTYSTTNLAFSTILLTILVTAMVGGLRSREDSNSNRGYITALAFGFDPKPPTPLKYPLKRKTNDDSAAITSSRDESSSSSSPRKNRFSEWTLIGGTNNESKTEKMKRLTEHARRRISSSLPLQFNKTAVTAVDSMLELKKSYWDDLAPPFEMNSTRYVSDGEEESVEEGGGEEEDVMHFCFLVHGHRGKSGDLSYLKDVINIVADREQKKKKKKQKKKIQQKEVGGMDLITTGEKDEDSFVHVNKEITPDEGNDSPLMNEEPVDSPLFFDDETDKNIEEKEDEATLLGNDAYSNKEEEEDLVINPTEYQQDQSNANQKENKHNIIVHNAVCNEYKTADGVEAGGDRLSDEIMDVIRSQVEKRRGTLQKEDGMVDVTLSFVGNSLGGIYSRYAIARLIEMNQSSENKEATSAAIGDDDAPKPAFIIDNKIRVYYNVFCTTATPHLGISKHTYVPLPRSVELGAAYVLGNTGRDLFRLNDLMKEMATSQRFLKPLSLFQKRVAYANAFFTDFPVPAETAAFLNPDSNYPHHFVDDDSLTEEEQNGGLVENTVTDEGNEPNIFENEESQDGIVRELTSGRFGNVNNNNNNENSKRNGGTYKDLVIATVHTPPTALLDNMGDATATSESHNNNGDENAKGSDSAPSNKDLHTEELALMSASLDSLGWKKVFVDIRGEIPIGVSVPSFSSTLSTRGLSERLRKKFSGTISSFSSLDENEGDENENDRGDAFDATTDENDVADTAVSKSDSTPCPVRALKRNGRVVESRDIALAVSTLPGDKRISFPVGHNMIAAVSRSRLTALMNRGGRPVMDGLAQELVEDILLWDDSEE